MDNAQGKAQKSYVLVLAVAHQRAELDSGDAQVEVRFGGQWHNVTIEDEGGVLVALLTDDLDIPKGTFDLQVRVKFNAGAPAGDIAIAAAGGSNADEGVWSDTVWAEAKIVKGGAGNGGTGNGGHDNGGNETKPNGGNSTTPIVDHGTGTGTGSTGTTGTGGNNGSTQTGGQLAETGTDAATTWALGAGGVALAMGAALVAGTGRRRRTTA
ncbi:LPXTG cell wall anchor domain-containing protein [Streptomyces sp. NPDC046557]|uniref:LPXTG cell wall anchor domain-containing protein n=1 Tax=Streptomyces sp. NPDC046557 TaxID=3155372 RepID=UPI003404C0F8